VEPREIAAIEANLFRLVRPIVVKNRTSLGTATHARGARPKLLRWTSSAPSVDSRRVTQSCTSGSVIWASRWRDADHGRSSWRYPSRPSCWVNRGRPRLMPWPRAIAASFYSIASSRSRVVVPAASRPRSQTVHTKASSSAPEATEQINPVNQVPSRCALTGKRIKSWALIPEVMDIDPSVDHRPCPFSGSSPHGSWFQWMRNLVSALALGRSHQVPAAFVVVYADGRFPMALNVRGQDWVRLATAVADRAVSLRAVSYQQLLSLALTVCAPADRRVLDELGAWMAGKIAAAAAAARDPAVDADC
jgi:hypothetical protein